MSITNNSWIEFFQLPDDICNKILAKTWGTWNTSLVVPFFDELGVVSGCLMIGMKPQGGIKPGMVYLKGLSAKYHNHCELILMWG